MNILDNFMIRIYDLTKDRYNLKEGVMYMNRWDQYRLAFTIFLRYGFRSNRTLTYKHNKYKIKTKYSLRILISNLILMFISIFIFSLIIDSLAPHIEDFLLLVLLSLLVFLLWFMFSPLLYYLIIPLRLDKLCEKTENPQLREES